MDWKYLHEHSTNVRWLDHRLTPEVSAMFAAMASRAPLGGIRARYEEVVQAIASAGWETRRFPSADPEWKDLGPLRKGVLLAEYEDTLCKYPLPTVVYNPRFNLKTFDRATDCDADGNNPGFFDRNVGLYGHSSIMELTGQPAVYVEGISWYAAYLSFDSPLCTGQEASTRAIRHKDWPMCIEAKGYSHELSYLHKAWLEVFDMEVNWWKEYFSKEENRENYGLKDDEPFRPALDRARWALPGTIATGFCHTGHLRERTRVILDALRIAQNSRPATDLWESIAGGYAAAVPGLAGLGMREAVYRETGDRPLPGHLQMTFAENSRDVHLVVTECGGRHDLERSNAYKRTDSRSYVDQYFNNHARVKVDIRPSLAAARDWHRHRTFYPWHMRIVKPITLHSKYQLRAASDAEIIKLMSKTREYYKHFMKRGDQYSAMLCLPLGTKVVMSAQPGLRDFIYAMELRANAHGANFEYEAQAKLALKLLKQRLESPFRSPMLEYLAL